MINIALLGYGVVATGLIELIEKNRSRGGLYEEINIKTILVRDKDKHRGKQYYNKCTTNFLDVINEDIDIVIEALGGVYPAYDYVKEVLLRGKSVVSSNKDLIAEHGYELIGIADDKGIQIKFEGAVGGGIPIIKPLLETLASNNINRVFGILNGTTNFILSKMKNEAVSYEEALKEAQYLGFAEADPSSDVLGLDAGRKLSILACLSYRGNVDWNEIEIEGITNIDIFDIESARKLNYGIKLIALGEKIGEEIYLKVAPMLVARDTIAYKVENENNIISIEGEEVGELTFIGKGAGKLPTGTAVFADLLDIIHDRRIIIDINTNKLKVTSDYKREYLGYYRVANTEYEKIKECIDRQKGIIETSFINNNETVVLVKTINEKVSKIIAEDLKNLGPAKLIQVLQ